MATLADLLDAQYCLQRQAFGVDPRRLAGETRRRYLNDNLFQVVEEVLELKRKYPELKFWHDPEPCLTDPAELAVQRDEALDEYADVLHFLLNVALALGFSGDELEAAYGRKVARNYVRQGRTPSVYLPGKVDL